MNHTNQLCMHGNEANERLQEAIDTSRIYIYTFYTELLLRRELILFESEFVYPLKYPNVYAIAIRAGLKRLARDMHDIKQYMTQLQVSIDERIATTTLETISHSIRLNKKNEFLHFQKKTLNKEVEARVHMYVFPLEK